MIEIMLYVLLILLYPSCFHGAILSGFTVKMSTLKRENQVVVIPLKAKVIFLLFGEKINTCSRGMLTPVKLNEDDNCPTNVSTASDFIDLDPVSSYKSQLVLNEMKNDGVFYFCLFCNNKWYHQGTHKLRSVLCKKMEWHQTLTMVICSVFLFILSGLFSGLNIGLMTLHPNSLKFLSEAGNEKERKFAKRIYPIRKHGNIVLCTLLFGNVLANCSLTICISCLIVNPVLTLSIVTFSIVVFGEILPQALGSRNALAFSYYTLWLTVIFILITFLLSYPLGKLLDFVVGKEICQPYSKEKLKHIIQQQEKLGSVVKDEMEIMSGALTLTEKTVIDVMTPISHAYMLSYNAYLNYNTMQDIVRNGYTRIPVYDSDKNNIKGLLNIKDLLLIDPQDNIPVSTICTFYNRQILIVPDDVKLTELLNEFKQGKAHLAFIEKLIADGDRDPFTRIVGLVTLEDVIEEILQDEIVDETDMFYDNNLQRKTTINRKTEIVDFQSIPKQHYLSPQLYEATYRYMSKKVPSFNNKHINIAVLMNLLRSKVVFYHFHNPENPALNKIITKGHFITNAILILQGKVSVDVSSEALAFEGGPFMMFGESVLKKINDYIKKTKFEKQFITDAKTINETFKIVADYSVSSIMDVQYVSISAPQYMLIRYLSNKEYYKEFDLLKSEIYTEDWEDLSDILPDVSYRLRPKDLKENSA